MKNLLLISLFLCSTSTFAKEISLRWSGVIPKITSPLNSPVMIRNHNNALKTKSWLVEDIEQKGKHNNEHAVVIIYTINI